jgi:hypothetical protein
MSTSRLETALRNARAVVPVFEHEIEILRNVLRGACGTSDQRNALARIIKQNAPRRVLMTKVLYQLNLPRLATNGSYLDESSST